MNQPIHQSFSQSLKKIFYRRKRIECFFFWYFLCRMCESTGGGGSGCITPKIVSGKCLCEQYYLCGMK